MFIVYCVSQIDNGAVQAKYVRFVIVMNMDSETEIFTPYFSVLYSEMYFSYYAIIAQMGHWVGHEIDFMIWLSLEG